jgi:predicted DNA-binding transcriptional regulator AlpA
LKIFTDVPSGNGRNHNPTNTMNQVDTKLLLSAETVAGLLDISKATFWRWVSAGRVPPPVLRHGGIVRWSHKDITEWIEQGCPDHEEARS